jgi:undecaprenyl-diphosphatase
MTFFQQLDISFIFYIQNHLRSSLLTPAMIFFSSIGTAGLVWILGGALMIVFKKTRYCGLLLLLCLGISWIINDMLLKPLIQRARPYTVLADLQALLPLRHDFSFPSGHTATSFATAFAVTRTLGKRWSWVYAVTGLISFSRIYLGMHYPSDVLGGAILGTLAAFAVCLLANKYLMPRFKDQPNHKRR